MPTSAIKPQPYKKIALTTGDPNGIGFEVTAKALVQYAKQSRPTGTLFFMFRDSKQELRQPQFFKQIDKAYTRLTFYSLETALAFTKDLPLKQIKKSKLLIDLSLKTSAADWIFEVTKACIHKKLDSVVTAPLSKTLIHKSGYSQIGHTGIFRSFFPRRPFHMGFVGESFSVVLATDHIPLRSVEAQLTSQTLSKAYASATLLRSALQSKKPIGVLGLNPHAGEGGLVGTTEKRLFKRMPHNIEGPLVPDAAFLKKNWSRYSLFLCLYHDQGLIPFKMHHGQDSGVHITLGLPFVRTSVDHGTAFDIYNKNLANASSMLDAICFNIKLLRKA